MSNPATSGYRALIKRIAAKAERYAFQVGLAEDQQLNALTGGSADQTFSLRNAQEAKAGDREACWVCWNLGWMIQRHHCPLTLAGQDIPPLAGLRAVFWITLVLSLPFLIWWHPLWIGLAVAIVLAVDIAVFHFVPHEKI